MNCYVIIGIIGIVSGILCALADVPLAYSGRKGDTGKLKVGALSPWWSGVSERRFTAAFWLSCIGQPGTYLTMWMLGVLIAQTDPALGLTMKINTFIGAYTGLLYHAVACIKPLVYRRLHDKLCAAEMEAVMASIDKYPRIPSLISALSLFLGSTVIVIIAITTGALNVPTWFVLFNPIVAGIVLLGLKKAGVMVIGVLGVGFSLFAIVLIAAVTV